MSANTVKADQFEDYRAVARKYCGTDASAAIIGLIGRCEAVYARLNELDCCMCGNRMTDHGISDNHAPVSMYDYHQSQLEDRVKELEAALKASHGPYGWLIMPEGLAEDAWYLAGSPEPGVPSEPLYSRRDLMPVTPTQAKASRP